MMQILINTGYKTEGRDELVAHITEVVKEALRRFSARITRVEVHLSDQSSHPSGPREKRCLMEARLEGHQPRAVIHSAASLDQSVDGAADKLKRALERILEKLKVHRGVASRQQTAPVNTKRAAGIALRMPRQRRVNIGSPKLRRMRQAEAQLDAQEENKTSSLERWEDEGGPAPKKTLP